MKSDPFNAKNKHKKIKRSYQNLRTFNPDLSHDETVNYIALILGLPCHVIRDNLTK